MDMAAGRVLGGGGGGQVVGVDKRAESEEETAGGPVGGGRQCVRAGRSRRWTEAHGLVGVGGGGDGGARADPSRRRDAARGTGISQRRHVGLVGVRDGGARTRRRRRGGRSGVAGQTPRVGPWSGVAAGVVPEAFLIRGPGKEIRVT